jgi:hypothetical protein
MSDDVFQKHAQAHADAVMKGDMQSVMGDVLPEALAKLGPIAPQMPNPVTSAEVVSVDVDGAAAVVRIAYTGADKTVTVQSHWVDKGDRPYIDDAAIV